LIPKTLRQKHGKEKKQTRIIIISSFFLIFFIIVISNYYNVFFSRFRLLDFEEGQKAPRDLIADNNYSYIDNTLSNRKIDFELNLVEPIFEINNVVTKSCIDDFAAFSEQYLIYNNNPSEINRTKIISDFSNYFNLEEIELLLESIDPYIIIPEASTLIEEILSIGVVQILEDISTDNIRYIQIGHWDKGKRVYSSHYFKDLLTLDIVHNHIDKKLTEKNIEDIEKYGILLVVESLIKENIFFNKIQTQIKYDEIRNNIDPVYVKIESGDYIINKGSVISSQDMDKAVELINYERKINVQHIFSILLFLVLIYFFAFIMFKTLFTNKKRKNQYIYLLISMYIIFILYTSVILHFSFTFGFNLSLFLPTALISMLVVILIGLNESILTVLILSVSLFFYPQANIESFIFSFVTGVSAALLMRGVKKRIDLLKPVALLAIINTLILLVGFPQNRSFNEIFMLFILASLNSFISSIFNLTLIPVFEHFLNVPTVFKLMELSDMNSPLFRKMVTMAPGTYGHSIAVANLADAACRDIGANALLARVGAYYHDIGKIDQAEYFIENQTEANKHDMINPSLSVAVIKSHVKVGIEKGKELKLPAEIIDIISQHHGSGLIGYFYIEAINKESANSKIDQKDYSYTGIPPESKEAAIVMLADTVEAASRVLKKPTLNRLEKFIWKLIMEKIDRGQMDNASLTMRDLLTIKKSFVHILSGYFHTRIQYPKAKRKVK
jgi:cyclic-di-AMP phosphodiesterase PgpH